MGGSGAGLFYVFVLVTATWASLRADRAPRTRPPTVVLVALLVVGVPSLLQLTVLPGLLTALERDRDRIAAGEVWRLVTALVVQDGGLVGTVFNLAFLAVLGTAAWRTWSTRQWLLVALASGLGGELWGLLVQPVGGGNSVVNFGLAGSLAAVSLRRGTRSARVLASLSLLGILLLLVTGDLHGGAAAVGALIGGLLRPVGPTMTPRGVPGRSAGL